MKKILFGIMLVLLVNMVSGQTKIRLSQIEDIQGTVIKSTGETSGKVLTTNGSNGTSWQIPATWQAPLNGTGFVKATGTSISYDNNTYYYSGNSNTTGVNWAANTMDALQYNLNGTNINTSGTLSNVVYKGTLTINYLPKHSGTQLTNSMIFDNGTNVGIGTSTPNAKLDVLLSSSGVSTNPLILTNLFGTANTEVALRFAPTASPTIRYAEISAFNDGGNNISLKFITGSGSIITEKMRVLYSGNVLINSTTDNGVDKLQVTGTASGTVDATLSNQFVRFGQLSISNWNTAYGWGNHSAAGYITDGNTGWDNSYGYITDGNTGWDNSYGFITSYTETDPNVYAWAKAATKPTYTAGEVGAQPAATVLTNTTASFTTAQETKLSGIATGAEVNVNADWNSVSGDSQILNKPTIPTNTNQLTNGAGFITDGNTGWDNSYGFITSEVDGSINNEGVIGVTSSGISKSVLLSTTTSGASGTVFTAGDGMTISGAYQSDGGSITYNLGTGGSITPTSTNSVSGNTHTHQISIYGTPSDGNTLKYSSTYGFSWGSSVDGVGSSDRLALWTGTNTQSSDADFTYNSTNNTLSIGSGSGNGYVTSGNFVNSSDRRLKERIRKLENLNWVDQIEFKNFEFKGDISDRLRYGVIAQEVEKINPELVFSDENGYKAVGYIDLLVAKVARQDEIINELLKRIEKLERDEK